MDGCIAVMRASSSRAASSALGRPHSSGRPVDVVFVRDDGRDRDEDDPAFIAWEREARSNTLGAYRDPPNSEKRPLNVGELERLMPLA